MAKRIPYNTLAEQNRELSLQLDVTERLVAALAKGESAQYTTEVIPMDRDDHWRYEWKLFEATRSHGGIVLKRASYPGQNDSFTVQRLDDLILKHQQVNLTSDIPFVEAMSKLRFARQTLLDLKSIDEAKAKGFL